jgi:hypothetical protein
MKYGTNFHTQSFVGHKYTACLALEHPVPAGLGFSTKSLFGKPLLTSLPDSPDTEYGASIIFHNVRNYLPADKAKHFEFVV